MKKKLVLFVLLIVVYMLGIMSGALIIKYVGIGHGFMSFPGGMHIKEPVKGGSPEQHLVELFSKKLDLSDEQKKQFIQILENNKSKIDKYRDEFYVKMEATMDSVDENMRGILNEKQIKVFNKVIANRPKMNKFPEMKPGMGPGRGFGVPPPERNR